MSLQAVILAAGRGTRLNGAANSKPKCLTSIGETSLLQYQLGVLRRLGVERICVVLGYQANLVKPMIAGQADFVVNDRFAETNSLYSLWLARDWVQGEFLVCNSDVLADWQIYQRLVGTPGTALAYDSASGEQEEHMKVHFCSEGNLRAIDKGLPLHMVHGENLGLLKFDRSQVSKVFSEATICLREDGENQWAPAVVNRLCRTTPVSGVDVQDLPWVEIDFPEDLQLARRSVWPKICETVGCKSCGHDGIIPSPGAARRVSRVAG